MARLKDKVCIITGATSGIGKRTAEIFAAEGAKLVIAGRREAEGRAVAKSIGAGCDFVQTDVTVEAQMQALIEFALRKHGRIDCLFNNAGGPAPVGGIETIPVGGFDAAMAVLLRSVMLGMKHVAPVMQRQRSGSIINNGSVAAHRAGLSSSMIYSAAKAAVVQLTRCVAMQLGEACVRVNSISPGGIATGIFGKALGLNTEEAEQTAEAVKAGLAKMQADPARRDHRRRRPGGGVPGQRRLELCQRARSGRRRRRNRRALMEPAPGRPARHEARFRH